MSGTTSGGSAGVGSASAVTVAAPGGDEVVDVTIHPLVLLSAADHYHRVARGTRKRVVGILLGQIFRGRVDATNSFAVPFEEDSRNPAVFYLDHNFLENMLAMFRKVNAKERVVGFYSTGPQIRPNDLRIHDIVQRYAGPSGLSVFCIIDIRPDRPDLPVTAYKVVEELSASRKLAGLQQQQQQNQSAGSSSQRKQSSSQSQQQEQQVQRSFAHVPSQMGAMEAEEVGVEHLLRDINDPTVSTVASLIKGKMAALSTLTEKLVECKDYLQAIVRGELTKINPDIIANLQTILNLLPNLNSEQLIRSMIVKTNDMYMAVYLASLIRSVIALHDLVNNKIRYGEDGTEREVTPPEKAASSGKDKASSAEETKDEGGSDAKSAASGDAASGADKENEKKENKK